MTERTTPAVITGPREARVPVIPLSKALSSPKRDGRVKPGHDTEFLAERE
jgi:hypothetical protein